MSTHTTGTQTSISQHWLDVLEENHVNFMALDPIHDTKLIKQLQSRPGWIIEYATEDAIFFVRDEIAISNHSS